MKVVKVVSRLSAMSLGLALAGCAAVPSPLAPGVSGSIGTPSHGMLTESAELPKKGKGFRRFRPDSARVFGTKALVDTLTFASAHVAKDPAAPPVLIADVAGRRGGKLSGHASHRTGRDVDVLLMFTTLQGVPIEAPGFVKVGADGLAEIGGKAGTSFVRFDVPRTWQLVKGLLTSPHAEVGWIFVAEWLEAMIIQHARAKGEDPELLFRATAVMHQPRDSAPHDDHLHVRIACTFDEAVHGCIDGTPDWPFKKARPELAMTPKEMAEDLEPLR